MSAINERGLVGKVIDTTAKNSRVILLTDPNLSIFPMKIPLPLIGTTPTDDPVKTQKSLLRFFLSFLTLFKTNLNEFNGFI